MVKYYSMVIFDGNKLAEEKKEVLKQRTSALLEKGIKPTIAAILYDGDAGSQLYTDIKKNVASQIGISYQTNSFSLSGGVEPIITLIKKFNLDPNITGIILQKPTRKSWAFANGVEGKAKDIRKAYNLWWRLQTSNINDEKDVDGLNPSILEVIREDKLTEKKRVLPATAQAVLEILKSGKINLEDKTVIIVGKSDLLGIPLHQYFLSKGIASKNIGRKELEERIRENINLTDVDIVISATGVGNLITGDLVKDGVVVVDVGEPKGDVEFESVSQKASFITPVPGGVGPMTVISLMENCLNLIS